MALQVGATQTAGFVAMGKWTFHKFASLSQEGLAPSATNATPMEN